MEKVYKFSLYNIVKYAKNHYSRSTCFWMDIALCLEADDYGPFYGYVDDPDNKRNAADEVYRERMNIALLICGKVQRMLKPYRWEAVTRAHLSELVWMEANDLGYDDWSCLHNLPEIPALKKPTSDQ